MVKTFVDTVGVKTKCIDVIGSGHTVYGKKVYLSVFKGIKAGFCALKRDKGTVGILLPHPFSKG